jgi:hypothetical protein
MRSLAVLVCAFGSIMDPCSGTNAPSEGTTPPILEWDAEAIPPVRVGLPESIDGGLAADAAPPLGGFDAGTCTGIARSCSLLTSGTCSTVMGCRESGECTGYASSCYTRYSSSSCISQSGCYWSSYDGKCSGSARSCSSFSASATCAYQSGCRWTLTCEGIETSCFSLQPNECLRQPGCSLR